MVDRPLGALRLADLVITPDYTHRVYLAYRYRNASGDEIQLTRDIVQEGDHIETVYDGEPIELVVVRRYNPAEMNVYLMLECRASETGVLEPLNP